LQNLLALLRREILKLDPHPGIQVLLLLVGTVAVDPDDLTLHLERRLAWRGAKAEVESRAGGLGIVGQNEDSERADIGDVGEEDALRLAARATAPVRIVLRHQPLRFRLRELQTTVSFLS